MQMDDLGSSDGWFESLLPDIDLPSDGEHQQKRQAVSGKWMTPPEISYMHVHPKPVDIMSTVDDDLSDLKSGYSSRDTSVHDSSLWRGEGPDWSNHSAYFSMEHSVRPGDIYSHANSTGGGGASLFSAIYGSKGGSKKRRKSSGANSCMGNYTSIVGKPAPLVGKDSSGMTNSFLTPDQLSLLGIELPPSVIAEHVASQAKLSYSVNEGVKAKDESRGKVIAIKEESALHENNQIDIFEREIQCLEKVKNLFAFLYSSYVLLLLFIENTRAERGQEKKLVGEQTREKHPKDYCAA
jgi:hypothetical protein